MEQNPAPGQICQVSKRGDQRCPACGKKVHVSTHTHNRYGSVRRSETRDCAGQHVLCAGPAHSPADKRRVATVPCSRDWCQWRQRSRQQQQQLDQRSRQQQQQLDQSGATSSLGRVCQLACHLLCSHANCTREVLIRGGGEECDTGVQAQADRRCRCCRC